MAGGEFCGWNPWVWRDIDENDLRSYLLATLKGGAPPHWATYSQAVKKQLKI